MRFVLILSILVALYAIGTLLFTGGFLLRRIVVETNSTCTKVGSFTHDLDNCMLKSRYKKAIVIVIDALRYDFVSYNHSGINALPYENKFQKLAKIIKERPEKSRLYRFIADPPTTTMQRLKGLTTGSLPTFVDAGANFAKTEISEDNFIDQSRSFNKSIVFMGDDTWTGLYPDRFMRSFPYPSFNVKDLHTVDNGVIGHLVPEMVNKDWDLLIGHLLGVDHCGHTFGPNHSIMGEKLMQMDDFIDNVIQNLDNDTILFVFGDHGMTKTGDHGGDSSEEVEAALFVYSNKDLGYVHKVGEEDITLSQIDFVASISLILGLPIPYQNLGIVISDLFRFCQDDDCKAEEADIEKELTLLKALNLNANQVRTYLKTYTSQCACFEESDLNNFEAMFVKAEREYEKIMEFKSMQDLDSSHLTDIQSSYRQYLLSVRSFLKRKWAQFDMSAMFFGLAFFVIALLANFYFILTENHFSFSKLLIFVFEFVASVFLFYNNYFLLSVLCFLLGCLHFIFHIWNKFPSRTVSLQDYLRGLNMADGLSTLIWFVYIMSLLSNSYVVYEGSVTSFLLQSCLFIQFICVTRDYFSSMSGSKNSKRNTPDMKSPIKGNIVLLVFFTLATNFLISLSRTFQTCREEQVNCSESILSEGESVVCERNQFLLSIFAILTIFLATNHWLQKNGNANGCSPAIVAFKYITFFSSLLVIMYWCLKINSKSSMKHLNSLALPVAKLVYTCVFVSLVMVVMRPLCTFVIKHVPPTVRKNFNSAILNNILLSSTTSQDVVPQIFHQLRTNWMVGQAISQQADDKDEPKIFVYGLATIFSSPLLALLLVLIVLLMMLLDVFVAPSMLLLCAALFIILEIHSLSFRLKCSSFDQVPTRSVIVLLLLSCEGFYSFGHHPTITSIRWEAAYHGFEGDFHYNFIPALLIILNTFASQVIIFLAFPLLVYLPFTRGLSSSKQTSDGNDNSSNGGDGIKGEFLICEDDKKGLMSQLCLKILLLCALKLLGMMVCVTLHRRHLMVWKIFAPRFIYEAVAFFIISAICVFNYLFFLRTFRAADKFVSNLK